MGGIIFEIRFPPIPWFFFLKFRSRFSPEKIHLTIIDNPFFLLTDSAEGSDLSGGEEENLIVPNEDGDQEIEEKIKLAQEKETKQLTASQKVRTPFYSLSLPLMRIIPPSTGRVGHLDSHTDIDLIKILT